MVEKEPNHPKIQEKEEPKVTDDEMEKRMQGFIEKYGYMDQLLNQIVYEILHSK